MSHPKAYRRFLGAWAATNQQEKPL
ncbi:uncharacterized protein METZ01_LOCUS483530, partial [marine metagenome]